MLSIIFSTILVGSLALLLVYAGPGNIPIYVVSWCGQKWAKNRRDVRSKLDISGPKRDQCPIFHADRPP